MSIRTKYTLVCASMCVFLGIGNTQTTTDAIMMPKGDICLAATYEHGSWDEYWEGTKLQANGNVGTLTRNSITPMFAYGILNKLNFYATVPYISTKSDAGQLNGVSGFQDLGLALKANIMEQQLWKGKIYALPVVEFSTPIANYLSDYAPFSIGHGADQFALRGILQYRLEMGFYLRGSVAHVWRTETRVERDYYYNNGSYYSEWMDVPNAWHYEATTGIWLLDNALKLEGNYTVIRCTSGDDIRIWNAGQPTNKANFDQVGGSIHYYIPQLPGLRVIAHYNTILEGRNMGKFTNYGGTLTYQFKLH